MSVTCELGAVPVQSDWLNSTLSPVVYGDIALSIIIIMSLMALWFVLGDRTPFRPTFSLIHNAAKFL